MICFLSNFSPCFKSPPDNGDFDGDGENFLIGNFVEYQMV